MMKNAALIEAMRGGLIVSCQPDAYHRADDPMNSPLIMAALARSAELGGAVGIRADSPADIAAIRKAVTIPIIGIYKVDFPGFEVRITPTLEHAAQIVAAGADIVATDATQRSRPGGLSAGGLIELLKKETGKPVFADISTVEEGIAAVLAGAHAVMTTLSGYTSYSPSQNEPDYELIRQLCSQVTVPVIAEGRVNTPEQAAMALQMGAWAVTVGSAITRPRSITERFVRGLAGANTAGEP